MTGALPRRLPRIVGLSFLPALVLASCGKGGDDAAAVPSDAPAKLWIVQADAKSPPPVKLTLHACAGLYNGKKGGSVFVEAEDRDRTWHEELSLKPDETLAEAEFLTRCVADFPTCVRYDYKAQQTLLPNVLTAAAALGAVPLDDSQSLACGSVAFDAKQAFADKTTPLLATQHVFEKFAKQTTGLAMLNPGYDSSMDSGANPAVTGDMGPALVDYVFSRKLFVTYLVNGCVQDHPERALLSTIVNAGNWKTPLGVFGYNATWNVLGGYLYEAQTLCLESRNMGAIPTETGNLSFYSSAKPITAPNEVQQNPLEAVEYDASKTYVAFVVGDGDNIAYIASTRHDWFRQRVDECTSGAPCPPLSWSISPHLPWIAPDLLRWYYDQSHKTKNDYFVLPPSGHLYSYPSSLAPDEQARFAAMTEHDASLLGITGTVHWEWFTDWDDAEEVFLPRYANAAGPIRGVFPVSVPYKAAAFPQWPKSQFYSIFTGPDGGRVVVFRSREWRGINDDKDEFYLSPQKMADELAGYPKGTVSWVYMTSDGGLTLDNSFVAMSKLLPAHVQLVSTDTAAKLALAAGMK